MITPNTEELLAILSAAATVVLEAEVQIISYQEIQEYQKFYSWISTGRQQNFLNFRIK